MSRLGIDFGTTSIKCALVTETTTYPHSVFHSKQVHDADVISSDGKHEQSVPVMISALRKALKGLAQRSKEDLLHVETVSICCQMHGIMFWNDVEDTSNLITWQDQRCSQEFLTEIRGHSVSDDLHTGYGSATLAWLARNSPQFLGRYRCCGTIADYFVYVLCGLQESVISDHNAQSWGYFDEKSGNWDYGAVKTAGIGVKLPRILKSGNIVGSVEDENFVIAKGAQVFVPIGDLQASVYSVLGGKSGRVFNYGTASQIVMTTERSDLGSLPKSVRRALYTHDHNLITAASLNGGNSVEVVVKLFSSLSTETKLDYETLMEMAYDKKNTKLRVCPVFFGERHATKTFGSFSNVTHDNLTVGDISAAVFRGIVENLSDMMSGVDIKGDVLYAVGIAERPVLQYFVKEILGDFTLFEKEVTAAYGAILFDLGNETSS